MYDGYLTEKYVETISSILFATNKQDGAAYAAERLVLQETCVNLKSTAYKQERLQIESHL